MNTSRQRLFASAAARILPGKANRLLARDKSEDPEKRAAANWHRSPDRCRKSRGGEFVDGLGAWDAANTSLRTPDLDLLWNVLLAVIGWRIQG